MDAEIGIFYGSTGGNAQDAAERIARALGKERCSVQDIARSAPGDLLRFRRLVLGSSTWGNGDVQDDWASFLPGLGTVRLEGVAAAFFGVGDQIGYPDTFVDAMGILHDAFVGRGAVPVGAWPAEGYRFDASRACRGGTFVGLALDCENQATKTADRVARWTAALGF